MALTVVKRGGKTVAVAGAGCGVADAMMCCVDTGMRQEHLYYACKLFGDYYYELGNTRPSGTATGFIVQGDDKRTLGLVTNRHFVEPGWNDELRQGTELTKLRASIWLTTDERIDVDIVSHPIFHDDPTVDACIFPLIQGAMVEVSLYGIVGRTEGAHKWAAGLEPGDSARLNIRHYVNWGYLDISAWYWSTVHPCEPVYFPGYPRWHDKSADRPIMRTGAIVSDPKENWRMRAKGPTPGDGSQQLLFDAFSTDGNSGSPVFAAQRGFRNAGEMSHYLGTYRPPILVGINAGHIEDQKSRHVGLSRMHKVSVIVDLARKITSGTTSSPDDSGILLRPS